MRGLPAPAPGGTVLDDADAVAEEAALLHLINLCAERGEHLLLLGREAPARWPVALPDLRSRLKATSAIGIGRPDDALLGALLARHFADRQLRVAHRRCRPGCWRGWRARRRRWPRRRRGLTARRWSRGRR